MGIMKMRTKILRSLMGINMMMLKILKSSYRRDRFLTFGRKNQRCKREFKDLLTILSLDSENVRDKELWKHKKKPKNRSHHHSKLNGQLTHQEEEGIQVQAPFLFGLMVKCLWRNPKRKKIL